VAFYAVLQCFSLKESRE